MARDLSQSTLAAFSARVLRPLVLVEIDWPGEMIRVHDRLGEIQHAGGVFRGIGAAGAIEGLGHESGLAVREVTLTLAGDFDAQIALDSPAIRERPVSIWIGALAEDFLSLTGEPLLVFKGQMRALAFQIRPAGGSSWQHQLQLTVQSHFADIRRRKARRVEHPSLASLAEQTLTWPE